MINNRQGGRRRGRGGSSRPSNSPNMGNRQDNRQRGNAAQLLEKYKGLARDAQMGGDRVQAENFLQFADHYFRVLNESRVRYEEQRRQRGDDSSDDDEDQDDSAQADSRDRDRDRDNNNDGEDRGNGQQRPRRQPRRPREAASDDESGEERISVESLPPAISSAKQGGDDAPKPARARRPRRPRGDGEEIAPAA